VNTKRESRSELTTNTYDRGLQRTQKELRNHELLACLPNLEVSRLSTQTKLHEGAQNETLSTDDMFRASQLFLSGLLASHQAGRSRYQYIYPTCWHTDLRVRRRRYASTPRAKVCNACRYKNAQYFRQQRRDPL